MTTVSDPIPSTTYAFEKSKRKVQSNLEKHLLTLHLQLEELETTAEIPFSGHSSISLLCAKVLTYEDEENMFAAPLLMWMQQEHLCFFRALCKHRRH